MTDDDDKELANEKFAIYMLEQNIDMNVITAATGISTEKLLKLKNEI